MQCGDAVIVRSQAERSRLQKIYSTLPQYVSVVPGFDSTVPGTVPDVDADRLVVWAPNVSAGELSVYAFAFLEHHQPVDFICLGELSDVPHHYYSIHDAERVLRKASVIIDASVNDPSTSIAFAGRGFGLACAESSGAHEYIRGCLTYDPMSFSSIMAAAARARADRRTSCIYRSNDELVLRQTLAAAQPERSKEQPFVSIVMATYNRPEHVRANLMQLKKQTYQNFEVIVVNDCGSSVKHIVDEFPFAKYMETPRNSGAAATLNVGLKAARGKYLAAVADDDRFYPNFLASSVAALEASRLPIVYGNIIVRLEKQAQDGQILTEGYCLNWDGTHDPLAVYWAMPNSVQGYLIRRDVMEKVDYYTEDLVCYSDHDFSIKLSKISDFVHNASVVGHMAWRCDGSNLSQIRVRNGEHAKEMQRAFERQCPPDRPLIAARQGMSVQGCLNAQSRPLFFVPAIPLNPVMPVESLSHS
jgi:hypothetical protein